MIVFLILSVFTPFLVYVIEIFKYPLILYFNDFSFSKIKSIDTNVFTILAIVFFYFINNSQLKGFDK